MEIINNIIYLHSEHFLLFYAVLIVILILEWPITILSISILAPKLWFWFPTIFILSFLWDLLWDLLFFIIWRFIWVNFFTKNESKKSKFDYIKKLEKQLKKHNFLDLLIVIKYTPPITSLGLIYLWFRNYSFKKFIWYSASLICFSSLIITSVWYFFWDKLKDSWNFWELITYFLIAFMIFYFIIKFWTKAIINYIFKK